MILVISTKLRNTILVSVLLIIGGCAGTDETSQEPAHTTQEKPSKEQERARDIALQHFINGSVHESKGEYAQAILEFQDALRYDQNHAIYYALAKNYSLLNKHSLAIEAARKAVGLSPENLDYRRTLADIYYSAFQLDSAIVQYEAIISRDSSNIHAWFNLARIEQSRKPLRALEMYDSMLERFGPQWEVLLQVAEINSSLGRHTRAAQALHMMLEMDPGNNHLRHSLAQTFARAGVYDSALVEYDELLASDPTSIEFLSEKAGVLLAQKKYQEAATIFDGILARDSVSVDAKVRIGESYFRQMEKDSTLVPVTRSLFQRIQKGHPDDWRPYWFLGAIAAIGEDDTTAVENFRKVTQLASWNADGWVYLASIYLDRTDFGQAAEVLESAKRSVPDDFRVNFYLGIAYNQLGRTQEAVIALERSRQINPSDIGALSQLALVYDSMERFEESDRLYEEGLKRDPDNHLLLNNYSYSLAERDLQLERSLDMATRAVTAQPENPSYLDTIGWIYFRLERYEEAERYISSAVEKGDVSAVVLEHLGDVYSRMGKKEQAIEHWTRALEKDKDNAELKSKIERGSI